MMEVPATKAAKQFAQIRQAAQREPVAVTHHGRITEVILSKQDYDEFVRLKERAGRSLWAWELSEESLAALAEARVDPKYDYLDALMDE
jgi:prevent-host-death family protein